MSHQKPSGDSGQGSKPEPEPQTSRDTAKPHGDKLEHAVDEAARKPPPDKR